MLAFAPILLALRRPCPSSMRPRSMCVHAKVKKRNQQTSNGRKRCKVHMKEHKVYKHNRHGKQSTRKQANKREDK